MRMLLTTSDCTPTLSSLQTGKADLPPSQGPVFERMNKVAITGACVLALSLQDHIVLLRVTERADKKRNPNFSPLTAWDSLDKDAVLASASRQDTPQSDAAPQ